MKRSRSIRLVLLGTTGLLLLGGCNQQDPLARNDFFESEQQCAQANDASACRQALMDARREHARTAPAFQSREACEARFGLDNCAEARQTPSPEQVQPPQSGEPQQTAQSGGSWFMPVMLGYMMGRAMGGAAYTPPSAGPAPEQSQWQGRQTAGGSGAGFGRPVYRDVNNTVYSGREPLGQTRLLAPPRPSPTTVARGGFGRTGLGTVSS